MTEPFIAEIRIFPYTFAPKGWALCDGQLLSISQNTALFSLIGTNYGGDGRTTFGLPKLRGSVPISQGQGPGLSPYEVGQPAGTEFVTLLQSEMPVHNHLVTAQTIDQGDNRIPSSTRNLGNTQIYQTATNPNTILNPAAVTPSGGSQPHSNLMPSLTFNFCIALEGVYPQRG